MHSGAMHGLDSVEIDSIAEWLVGRPEPGMGEDVWFEHLSHRLALATAAAERIARQRDAVVERMLVQDTERGVAKRLGITHGRVRQLAKRERSRRQAVDQALASVRVDGLEPSADAHKLLSAVAAGAMDEDEAVEWLRRQYQK
jgi:hypothetical protein